MKLYDLTTEYQKILSGIEESQGLLTPEALEALDAVEGEFADKVDNYAALIRTLQYEACALKDEEERLAARRGSVESNIESLKVRLHASLVRVGQTKVKGPRFSVSLRSSQRVEIEDPRLIPPELMYTESYPVKASISEILKAGGQVPGCKLTKSESVQIR